MLRGITKCCKCDKKAQAADENMAYCAKHWFDYVIMGDLFGRMPSLFSPNTASERTWPRAVPSVSALHRRVL